MTTYRWIALSAIVATTVGCAQITSVKPGTALTTVEKQFGAPTTLCAGPDGTKRAIWSQQPMGQYAFATNVDAQSRVSEFEQILTDRSFNQLGQGVWTPEQVRCAFGPPESIDKVGLPSNLKIVWSYRYRQSDVWNSLMYVFFGTDGKVVTEHYPGPDPMYMYDRIRFF